MTHHFVTKSLGSGNIEQYCVTGRAGLSDQSPWHESAVLLAHRDDNNMYSRGNWDFSLISVVDQQPLSRPRDVATSAGQRVARSVVGHPEIHAQVAPLAISPWDRRRNVNRVRLHAMLPFDRIFLAIHRASANLALCHPWTVGSALFPSVIVHGCVVYRRCCCKKSWTMSCLGVGRPLKKSSKSTSRCVDCLVQGGR